MPQKTKNYHGEWKNPNKIKTHSLIRLTTTTAATVKKRTSVDLMKCS